MEVILLKSGEFSFNPAEKHAVFVAGSKVDLPEGRAKYLISVDWAKEVLAEDPVIEDVSSTVEIESVLDASKVAEDFGKVEVVGEDGFLMDEPIHKAVADVPNFKKHNVTKHGRN